MKLSKATLLRQRLEDGPPLRLIGAHNGLSAKLGQEAGFDGIWASGFEISASYGLPDANILTMTEFYQAATVINEAIDIPVIADCDTGYGNSNNVIQVVHKYEAAGIAGVCIEDKLFPKVNSFIAGRQELASIAEFVGKILAAKNAQQSKDFMVFARVEALIAGWGMEEALTRAKAYVEAGADGILIHSKQKTPEEILTFVKAWDQKVPLLIVPTTYPSLNFEKIKAAEKIRVAIYANQGLRSAVRAMKENLSAVIQSGSTESIEDKIEPMSTLFELQGMYEMKRNEEKYLRNQKPKVSALIIAAGEHKHGELMSTVLRETPLLNLDLNGKSLLERNLAVLSQQGIQDVKVITGYQGEKIEHSQIQKIPNPHYQSSNSLSSVLLGLQHCEDKTVVLFGDILFDRPLLQKLLDHPQEEDFLLVVDSSLNHAQRQGKTDPDLVQAQLPPPQTNRPLQLERKNPIQKIQKSLDSNEALYEFTGVFSLSPQGIQAFKAAYEKAQEDYAGKAFYTAPSLAQASVVDFFQYLLETDHEIFAVETFGGWQELHSFADYQEICAHLA